LASTSARQQARQAGTEVRILQASNPEGAGANLSSRPFATAKKNDDFSVSVTGSDAEPWKFTPARLNWEIASSAVIDPGLWGSSETIVIALRANSPTVTRTGGWGGAVLSLSFARDTDPISNSNNKSEGKHSLT